MKGRREAALRLTALRKGKRVGSATRSAPTRRALPARAAAAAARVEELRARRGHPGALELLLVAEARRDAAHVGLLLGQDERDPAPGAAGAAGAADAVQVALVVLGRVEVD